MNKTLPIILWIMVFIFGGLTLFYMKRDDPSTTGTSAPLTVKPEEGTAYQQIPWKHFPNVTPFKLTNQLGEEFDSAELAGSPYVISFFFAECPGECRELNKQIQSLREKVTDPELKFFTLSVDPENDTPDVLKRYAADFDADPETWMFLTGDMYNIKEVGEKSLRVIIDKYTHTENIFLVDRWGRFRDRFEWKNPYDMKRFVSVTKDVLAETEPPMDATFHSRNMMAVANPEDISSISWIREFHLTDQDGQPFFSRDLTGKVWIGNFFFTNCPGICTEQTKYLAALQDRLADHPADIVSITSDPNADKPEVLRQYADKVGADTDSWTFCTSDKPLLIRRSGSEFFQAHTTEDHHSSRLFVVDRFGQLRGDFDWQDPAQEVEMFKLIDELNAETVPSIIR